MKARYLCWLFPLACLAQDFEAQPWRATDVWGLDTTVHFSQRTGLPVLPIPTKWDQPSAVAFLTTIRDVELLGDLRHKVIVATGTLTTQDDPLFSAAYPSGVKRPCNFRLYFTDTAWPYSLSYANHYEDRFWWCATQMAVLERGRWTLTAVVEPCEWSDSQGKMGTDARVTAGFWKCASNVRQIGLSFGGGSYYDVGVGITNSAAATLYVLSFDIVPHGPRQYKSRTN